MEIIHFDRLEAFSGRAGSFLLRHEAEHGLILGTVANLMQGAASYQPPLYFATIEDGGEVVGAAMRTPPHNLVLSKMEPEGAIPLLARDVHSIFGSLPGVAGETDISAVFAEEWTQLTGQPHTRKMGMRIFKLTAVRPVAGVAGQPRPIAPGDRDWLARWLHEFNLEAIGEDNRTRAEELADLFAQGGARGMWVWEDGQPVSIAGFSGPTAHGIRVVAVYTPPQFRGKGYASACVAALSQHLLDSGRKFCFLFTDLANLTSNHIYQEIGYQPVCDVDEYGFDPAGA